MDLVPLFKPAPLSGKYARRVAASPHRTTGPQCARLKKALAAEFPMWTPDQIVLGNSATACFEALLRVMKGKVLFIGETYPLLPSINQRQPSHSAVLGYVHTDIGGVTADRFAGYLLDCCHSWAPSHRFEYSLVSFYPTKLVPGVEGGALFCQSTLMAQRLQATLNCGFFQDLDRTRTRVWEDMESNAMKGNMTDVAAAYNREALEHLHHQIRGIRNTQVQICREIFEHPRLRRGRYLMQVQVPDVPEAQKIAKGMGVASGWNFPPNQWLTVPSWAGMNEDQIGKVTAVVRKLLRST
jgi:dTDP-4-amino-4,6-dideoxygalactose transaminase